MKHKILVILTICMAALLTKTVALGAEVETFEQRLAALEEYYSSAVNIGIGGGPGDTWICDSRGRIVDELEPGKTYKAYYYINTLWNDFKDIVFSWCYMGEHDERMAAYAFPQAVDDHFALKALGEELHPYAKGDQAIRLDFKYDSYTARNLDTGEDYMENLKKCDRIDFEETHVLRLTGEFERFAPILISVDFETSEGLDSPVAIHSAYYSGDFLYDYTESCEDLRFLDPEQNSENLKVAPNYLQTPKTQSEMIVRLLSEKTRGGDYDVCDFTEDDPPKTAKLNAMSDNLVFGEEKEAWYITSTTDRVEACNLEAYGLTVNQVYTAHSYLRASGGDIENLRISGGNNPWKFSLDSESLGEDWKIEFSSDNAKPLELAFSVPACVSKDAEAYAVYLPESVSVGKFRILPSGATDYQKTHVPDEGFFGEDAYLIESVLPKGKDGAVEVCFDFVIQKVSKDQFFDIEAAVASTKKLSAVLPEQTIDAPEETAEPAKDSKFVRVTSSFFEILVLGVAPVVVLLLVIRVIVLKKFTGGSRSKNSDESEDPEETHSGDDDDDDDDDNYEYDDDDDDGTNDDNDDGSSEESN